MDTRLVEAVEQVVQHQLLGPVGGAQEAVCMHVGIAAERPADALSVLGWHGAVNYDQDADDLSIVLRSWQERFGATLVGVGFDTIYLLVARPPCTLEAAQRVAAEHFAFCSDSVYQGVGSISQLADDLIDGPIWSFWWD